MKLFERERDRNYFTNDSKKRSFRSWTRLMKKEKWIIGKFSLRFSTHILFCSPTDSVALSLHLLWLNDFCWLFFVLNLIWFMIGSQFYSFLSCFGFEAIWNATATETPGMVVIIGLYRQNTLLLSAACHPLDWIPFAVNLRIKRNVSLRRARFH